VSNKSKAT